MGISRLLSTIAVNNDKTGYTLTAGSYSIRASSTQRGTATLGNNTVNTASISSVTSTRATEHKCGQRHVGTDEGNCRMALTASTTLTFTSDLGTATDGDTVDWRVEEHF